MTTRLDADNYLWHIAFAVAKRGTCDRFFGGCVIARDGVLIASGYVGSAPGEAHCSEAGHEIVVSQTFVGEDENGAHEYTREEHCIRTIHAEVNAIVSAAYLGVRIAGCDWYCTGTPCKRCAMIMSRLKPRRLFLCSDRGNVDVEKTALIEWWYARHKRPEGPEQIHTRTLEQLKEAGVA